MQLEQQFDLPVPPAAAWPAFADVPLLVSCLPGAALTGEAVDGDWPLRFDVKMGPMAAGFVGSGQASHDHAAHSGRFDGAATDKRSQSRVKGAASFSLAPADASGTGRGTRVTVLVDYTLTGPLAQFSRGGLVRELASALTAQFAANLAARLQVAASAPPPASASASAPASTSVATEAVLPAAGAALPAVAPPVATAAAAQPLRASGLLWQVLRQRWRRWWSQLFQRQTP